MRGDMAASLCAHIGYRVKLDLGLMQIFCRVMPAEDASPYDGSAQGTLRGKSMNFQTGCPRSRFTKNSMRGKGVIRHS